MTKHKTLKDVKEIKEEYVVETELMRKLLLFIGWKPEEQITKIIEIIKEIKREQEQIDITEFLKGLERLNDYAGLKWHVPKEEVNELIEYWKKKQDVQWYEDERGKKYNLEFYNPETKMWNVKCLICNSIHEQSRRMDTCEKCWKGTVCLHPRKKEN